MSNKERSLQDIGRGTAECIADMVAALECDYDRLEELRVIGAGIEVSVTAHASETGTGLTYGTMEGMTLHEATNGQGWDLVDLTDADGRDVSVYAFSIVHPHADELTALEDAAGDCTDREDAERRIQEGALSIALSGTWPLGETPVADRALILLGTGGPAVRIVCELDEHREPRRAWIQAQDWGTPWTDVHGGVDTDALLTYCQQFYFGG